MRVTNVSQKLQPEQTLSLHVQVHLRHFLYYRQLGTNIAPSLSAVLLAFLLCVLPQGCAQIPDAEPTGPVTDVASFGFSVLIDTSLVADGWSVREFEYTPNQPQQFRSVFFPVTYEMFVDRPSNNGRKFQPLNFSGPRVERGDAATRIVVRVARFPEGLDSFDAIVDTVRNLNQVVSEFELNGMAGKELSRSNGNSNDPEIYTWSHAPDMVPRFIFAGDRFLYFVNTFESKGGNADTLQVSSVLRSLRID